MSPTKLGMMSMSPTKMSPMAPMSPMGRKLQQAMASTAPDSAKGSKVFCKHPCSILCPCKSHDALDYLVNMRQAACNPRMMG